MLDDKWAGIVQIKQYHNDRTMTNRINAIRIIRRVSRLSHIQ